MKTPDEINMNAENAFVLREAAKAHGMGYYDHLAHGGKGDPAEERWIEALNAGADALAYIQQLERERDAAVEDICMGVCCETCIYADTDATEPPCVTCARGYGFANWQWRGVKEE